MSQADDKNNYQDGKLEAWLQNNSFRIEESSKAIPKKEKKKGTDKIPECN